MKSVAVDPGESTGYAIFEDGGLVCAGTAELWEFVEAIAAGAHLHDAIANVPELRHVRALPEDEELWRRVDGWEELVIEDWQLYPWELKSLAWDKCRTARAIGALEFIARLTGREYVLQPAKIKEGAIAGGAQELFLTPLHENRHANDAIMHGVFRRSRAAWSEVETPRTVVV